MNRAIPLTFALGSRMCSLDNPMPPLPASLHAIERAPYALCSSIEKLTTVILEKLTTPQLVFLRGFVSRPALSRNR